MKNFIATKTNKFQTYTRFFGSMLAVALLTASVAMSIPTLNLRSTSNFAILAGSTITSIPPLSVKGDVGLSPSAGSYITGFSGLNVAGILYVVDASGPAGSVKSPALLTAAKGDMTTAYNDAKGRTPIPTGPFLNPGAGNIGGLTLAPGLYKFTSTAAITGNNLTLTGTATDVWIFQIASSFNVSTGRKVILAGGAKASNIFWQVGSSATLGTYTDFKGTIIAAQSISFGTGAVLEGRALAFTGAVTMGSGVVVKLPGTTISSPKISFSPSTVNFSSVRVLTTKDLKCKIINTGSAALTVSALNISGLNKEQYAIINQSLPFAVNANSSKYLTIRFTPTSVGTKTASCALTSNSSTPLSFSLTGKGYSYGKLSDEDGTIANSVENSFSVYPNPAKDNFSVAYSISSVQNLDISVMDLLGNQVVSSKVANNQPGSGVLNLNTVDANGNFIQNGYYIVLIKSNANTMSYPLIINR